MQEQFVTIDLNKGYIWDARPEYVLNSCLVDLIFTFLMDIYSVKDCQEYLDALDQITKGHLTEFEGGTNATYSLINKEGVRIEHQYVFNFRDGKYDGNDPISCWMSLDDLQQLLESRYLDFTKQKIPIVQLRVRHDISLPIK